MALKAAPPSRPLRYHDTAFWRTAGQLAVGIDNAIGWDRLPRVLGLPLLVILRDVLRRNNLYDTGTVPSVEAPPVDPHPPGYRMMRTIDGSYNDLAHPKSGMAGTRFGRNIPLAAIAVPSRTEMLRPSPREISRRLMTREKIIEATSVNALVAPWLQFMIRDWFSHGTSPTDNPWVIDLADDDDWGQNPMLIPRTMDDPTRAPTAPASTPTFINTCTHWWDASQIYGTTAEYQQSVRSGEHGKLKVERDGTLPLPPGQDGSPTTEPGFWIGLVVLQTLFTREHNAVCDMLHAAYPTWDDEQLFQRARLVVSALIAKIHTVEWTPAVISHPTTATALRANWFGLVGERVRRRLGRISSGEIISGIPGSPTRDHGVPYSLTEEFTAVYRMHPLMPDMWSMRTLTDDSLLAEYTLRELSGPDSLRVLDTVSLSDMLYSFGTMHPGLVTLHNFPRFLQEFVRPDGRTMDLAATDILRHRELGVPRYCEFRRQLHLRAPRTFADLTDDAATARAISDLYDGDIEQVDLMVGMFAERLPSGFAFSDTAFRIFILMASRRLNSDRFLAHDYSPAVYTRPGLEWIADNSMKSVLLRHHPDLRAAIGSRQNAFLPWTRPTAG
jgi:Animal haem peroxidase